MLANHATVSDAWTYSGGRWGLSLPASSMSFYKHGSVSADITAAKPAASAEAVTLRQLGRAGSLTVRAAEVVEPVHQLA